MLLLVALFEAAALAAPHDVAATTLGVQARAGSAVSETDLDALFAQRLRWHLINKDSFTLKALLNSRFTYDLNHQPGVIDPYLDDNFVPAPENGPSLQRGRVTALGVQLQTGNWTFDVGRSAVFMGGPRLVDGVQAIYSPGSLHLGVWAGLAPDLFTTKPRMRPGGGPVFAWMTSRFQASVAGEFVTAPEGGVDRVAVLSTARWTASRLFDLSGRLDIELAGENGPHLSDFLAFGRLQPSEALRFDLMYNGFSSYKYQQSELLDLNANRFSQRIVANGINVGLIQDSVDPALHHLLGTTIRWQPVKDGVKPKAAVVVRYRNSPVDELRNSFVDLDLDGTPDVNNNNSMRINPQLALLDLPIAGLLDAQIDANLIQIDGGGQTDIGLTFLWEPGGEESGLSIDTSGRMIMSPLDYCLDPDAKETCGGVGWYADLFVDAVILPANLIVTTGFNVLIEPDIALIDQEFKNANIGMFGRVTKYFKGKKPPLPVAPPVAPPPPKPNIDDLDLGPTDDELMND